MSDFPTRFFADLPITKTEHLLQVYAYLVAGDPNAAAAYFSAHRQDVSDAAGGIRYWLDRRPKLPLYDPRTGIRFTIPWGDGKRYATRDVPATFGDNVIVVQIDVPADARPFAIDGSANAYEFGGTGAGGTMMRQVSISDLPGDFDEKRALRVSGGVLASIIFNVQRLATADPREAVVLQPGQTYYFNVKNFNPAPGVDYQAAVEIRWPHD